MAKGPATGKSVFPLVLPWAVFAITVSAGALLLAAHGKAPIVRNSLLYARISHLLAEEGIVSLDWAQAYKKSIGFSLLSLPLVKHFGANLGLKISSFLWTVLWLAVSVLFFQRLREEESGGGAGIPDPAFALFVMTFNPLVLYQFISAYPDSLFALSFTTSLLLLDQLLSRKSRWYSGPAFAISALFGIWVKHHGFIILPVLLIFLFCRRSVIRELFHERPAVCVTALVSFAAFVAFIILARQGVVPLFNLGRTGHNYLRTAGQLQTVLKGLQGFAQYGLLSFGVLAPILLMRGSWRIGKEWCLTAAVFLLTLLIYKGTWYNLRYFLALSPIFAWIAARGLLSFQLPYRKAVLGLFVITNFMGSAVYLSPTIYQLCSGPGRLPVPRINNLRLVPAQEEEKRQMEVIRELSSRGRNVLFFVSHYYGDGSWTVWERDGFYPSEVKVYYTRSWSSKILEEAECTEMMVYFFDPPIPPELEAVSEKVYVPACPDP